MKRSRNMKNYIKQGLLLSALTAVAGSAGAVDYYLAAKAFTKTLPATTPAGPFTEVAMWGYVEDPGGDCYNTTPASARLTCVNSLSDPVAPGPRLTVSPTDNNLRIFLSNGLPEPTSIVLTGQELPWSANNNGPTWSDNTIGPRGGVLTKRVRSFGREASANGGRLSYRWTNFRQNPIDSSGTNIYHSGTHPQKQVYMGMYGAVTKDNGVGEAYPSVFYDNEVILFYSEIDPAMNAAINAGTHSTSIDYHPQWFLVNGEPYEEGVTPDIAAGAAGSQTLVRYLSTAGETHVPTLQGLNQNIHAEDGIQYTWQNGATGASTAAPRVQYTAMLPPLKTKDAIITAPAEGRYAVYDGNGYMTNPSDPDDFGVGDTVGGMLRFLSFAAGTGNQAPVAVNDEATTPEDTPVDINVLSNDTDPDPGDVLTIDSVTQGSIGAVIISDPSCCVRYTPNPNANGMDQFTYTITDGNGVASTATASVDVTVTAVNDPPSIISTAVTMATASQLYSYDVDATDADPGDVLTFSLDAVPPAGMGIDGTTGLISWTPTLQQFGPHDVTVRVTDLGGLFDIQSYTVTVDAAAGTLFFSTLQGVAVPDVDGPYNNADIYAYDGAAFSRILAFVAAAGFNANVDSLHMADADTFYLSFSNPSVIVPSLGVVQDEDVVLYDGGNWSLYFDGATCGLNTNGGQDIDAISIESGTLYFSTLGGGNSNPVTGVAAPYDDADVYTWVEGDTTCGRVVDASANGLPGNADIDGLTLKGGTYYMSFNRNGGTTVPVLGTVQDEAVVSYDGAAWELYFSGPGLDANNGQDIDAVHLP